MDERPRKKGLVCAPVSTISATMVLRPDVRSMLDVGQCDKCGQDVYVTKSADANRGLSLLCLPCAERVVRDDPDTPVSGPRDLELVAKLARRLFGVDKKGH